MKRQFLALILTLGLPAIASAQMSGFPGGTLTGPGISMGNSYPNMGAPGMNMGGTSFGSGGGSSFGTRSSSGLGNTGGFGTGGFGTGSFGTGSMMSGSGGMGSSIMGGFGSSMGGMGSSMGGFGSSMGGMSGMRGMSGMGGMSGYGTSSMGRMGMGGIGGMGIGGMGMSSMGANSRNSAGGKKGGRGGSSRSGGTGASGELRASVQMGFQVPMRPGGVRAGEIQTRMTKMPIPARMNNVQVVLDGRTAVLQGSVDSAADELLAQRLISLEPGIDSVRSELQYPGKANGVELLPAGTPEPATQN